MATLNPNLQVPDSLMICEITTDFRNEPNEEITKAVDGVFKGFHFKYLTSWGMTSTSAQDIATLQRLEQNNPTSWMVDNIYKFYISGNSLHYQYRWRWRGRLIPAEQSSLDEEWTTWSEYSMPLNSDGYGDMILLKNPASHNNTTLEAIIAYGWRIDQENGLYFGKTADDLTKISDVDTFDKVEIELQIRSCWASNQTYSYWYTVILPVYWCPIVTSWQVHRNDLSRKTEIILNTTEYYRLDETPKTLRFQGAFAHKDNNNNWIIDKKFDSWREQEFALTDFNDNQIKVELPYPPSQSTHFFMINKNAAIFRILGSFPSDYFHTTESDKLITIESDTLPTQPTITITEVEDFGGALKLELSDCTAYDSIKARCDYTDDLENYFSFNLDLKLDDTGETGTAYILPPYDMPVNIELVIHGTNEAQAIEATEIFHRVGVVASHGRTSWCDVASGEYLVVRFDPKTSRTLNPNGEAVAISNEREPIARYSVAQEAKFSFDGNVLDHEIDQTEPTRKDVEQLRNPHNWIFRQPNGLRHAVQINTLSYSNDVESGNKIRAISVDMTEVQE